jgi:anhydro-N-acetylmuramic acid kinase
MSEHNAVWAIGLMSGTSLDGLDGALIRTDGERVREFGPRVTLPMPDGLANDLRGLMRGSGADWLAIEKRFTEAQVPLVERLLAEAGKTAAEIGCIGFHGQTIVHRPAEGITWQIGNGAWLAEKTGIAVVADFRRRDVAAGGQGAPLVPLYHAALVASLKPSPFGRGLGEGAVASPNETSQLETTLTPRPLPGGEGMYSLAVLNIGGISNVTLCVEPQQVATGEMTSLPMPTVYAMDCGPGNALLNDWVRVKMGWEFDEHGQLAAAGRVDEAALEAYLAHPFFTTPPPKSLDRHDFTLEPVAHLTPEDGAATLAAFTVVAVAQSVQWLPEVPNAWLVCGGGRHNPVVMEALRRALNAPVEPVEAVGWNGDSLEAEAFAFLAVRMLRGLPISTPETTGVSRAVTGGAFYGA